MLDLIPVFTKVFVREFYRLNAGFFILVITLTFGFMSGVEHRALAEFFVASPVLSLFPVAVWIVYALKVILFNHQRIQLPQNSFIFSSWLLPRAQQFLVALQTLSAQLVPMILYAIFLIVTALKNNRISSLAVIVLSLILIIAVSTAILLRTFKTPGAETKVSALKLFIDRNTVRPLPWIYVITILRQEPFMFFGTKVFTGLFLFAVSQLYNGQTYDGRLLAMATSIAAASNSMVMAQLQLFDFKYFSIMRSLPLKLVVRWMHIALITLIFIAPEMVMLIRYAPVGWTDLIYSLLLLPALSLCLYSIMYLRFENDESYARLTFGITILHVLLILFKMPVIVLVAVDLTASWLIFRARYYAFELRHASTTASEK